MSIIQRYATKAFAPAPAGSYPARCYRIVDLGHQTETYEGKTTVKPKVRLDFELLDDELLLDDGRHYSIGRKFTVSLGKTSALRPLLESWRGAAFSDADLQTFDLPAVLGKLALVNVVHEPGKDGTTRAKLAGLSKLPKGMPAAEPTEPTVLFSLGEPDMTAFNKLPDWMRAEIEQSPEWKDRRKPSSSATAFDDMADDAPY